MYYVYVLQDCLKKTFYIGYTANLRQRIDQHASKRGGRTTSLSKDGYKLVYYEAYCNKKDALGREKFLKGGSGHKYLKKQLVHFLSS